MLNGRNADAVDVADGAVAEAESREDTQSNVLLLHVGVLFAYMGKTVIVDGVERTFYLFPFVWIEGDESTVVLVKFLQRFRTFEDDVLQKCHHFIHLMQRGLLMLCLLLEPTSLLFLHTDAITKCLNNRKKDDDRSNDDNKEHTTIHL